MTVHATAISDLDAFALGDAFRSGDCRRWSGERRPRPGRGEPIHRQRLRADRPRADARLGARIGGALGEGRAARPLRRRRGDDQGQHGGRGLAVEEGVEGRALGPRDLRRAGHRALQGGRSRHSRARRPCRNSAGSACRPLPLTGHTRNPWNLDRTAGGSTSGGAVAAALGHRPLPSGLGRAGVHPHPRRLLRRLRHQGDLWTGAGLSDLGHGRARPSRPHRPRCPGGGRRSHHPFRPPMRAIPWPGTRRRPTMASDQ